MQVEVLIKIIPAYAGNTTAAVKPDTCNRDHPRVCGEHSVVYARVAVVWGSSPRMRGTLHVGDAIPDLDGIIPAYAGNTSLAQSYWRVRRDHPRVCGEHARRAIEAKEARGSSPRMRGTPFSVLSFSLTFGIIPAYAGNTGRKSPSSGRPRDHPRVCGEHSSFG